MTVLRCGHLWSTPVVVEVGSTHGVGTAYTPCVLVGLHAPSLACLLDGILPLHQRANASALPN